MMDEKGLDEEAGMGVMKCENTKDRKEKNDSMAWDVEIGRIRANTDQRASLGWGRTNSVWA